MAGDGVVQVADLRDREYASDSPVHRAAVDIWGVRTLLMVPLRKDGISKRVIAKQLGVRRTSVIRLLRSRKRS